MFDRRYVRRVKDMDERRHCLLSVNSAQCCLLAGVIILIQNDSRLQLNNRNGNRTKDIVYVSLISEVAVNTNQRGPLVA